MHNALRKFSVCIATFLLALPVVSMADEKEIWSAHADTKREACSDAKELAENAALIVGSGRIGGGIAVTNSSCDCEQLLDGRWNCEATVKYRLTLWRSSTMKLIQTFTVILAFVAGPVAAHEDLPDEPNLCLDSTEITQWGEHHVKQTMTNKCPVWVHYITSVHEKFDTHHGIPPGGTTEVITKLGLWSCAEYASAKHREITGGKKCRDN